MEFTAQDVATDIDDELTRWGWKVERAKRPRGGRTSNLFVTLPNGQRFKVRVEDLDSAGT